MLKNFQRISAFLCIGWVSILSAQKGTLSIEYSYGSSIPLGDFREANSQNYSSGYAKTGFSSQAGLKYQINEGGFSVVLSTQTQAHNFDVASYDREITLLDPTLNWSIVAEIYSMSAFLAGLQQDFKVSEKTKVGVIAQLGLGLAKDPMMSIMELNSGYWSVSTNNYASAVAFKFGGQAKINFAKNFYVTVSANLMAADFDFKQTEAFYSNGDYESYSYSKDFNTFNVQLGLAADLYKHQN